MEEVPFDDRRVPKVEMDWDRSCWWWYPLTRALHPAVRSSSLGLSLVAILLLWVGWTLGVWVFRPQLATVANPVDPLTISGIILPFNSQLFVWCVYCLQSSLVMQLGLAEAAFLSFEFLWIALVGSVLGGILARRAMVELGQRTVAPWIESMVLVGRRWQSYLWAASMNVVGIAFLLVPIVIVGWLARLGDVGGHIAGVLLLLMFPIAMGVGRLCLSLTVCWPLSVCAIGAEKKADAFEGFSRSNAYFFQRPFVVALCVVFLVAVGYTGEILVYWVVSLGWWVVRSAFLIAGGSLPDSATHYVSAGNWLSQALIAAYWFSFLWSAAGALYLVLRRCVDHKELDELDLVESEELQSLPTIPSVPAEPTDAATANEENPAS